MPAEIAAGDFSQMNPVSALRIAFAGTPEFALPALNALLDSSHAVVAVLTQPDRPKGRGRQLAASAVKLAAASRGVPVFQPPSLKTDSARADLLSWQLDVLVVVAYGVILPRAVLDLPRLGCINIHASLLPRWRGAAPIQRAILAGDSQTGVTIMQMDAGLDTGPMLLRRRVAITEAETAASLHDRLAADGAGALLEVLEKIAQGSAMPTAQPTEGVTYAAKIDKAEALIDWAGDVQHIDRQIRAFNPRPIAETRYEGEQLRIHAARVQDRAPRTADPGRIVAVRDEAIVVACGHGHLAITEVQRPGGRPVAAHVFAQSVSLSGRLLG